MDAAVFRQLKQIAYDKAGIELRPGKESLVSARVNKRLRALGLESYREYMKVLDGGRNETELIQFLDVISTNFTNFYRERVHFEVLDKHLKDLASHDQRRFRIWCAAASSGEEPYTLAITVREALAGVQADAKILATDISTRVLMQAVRGMYPKKTVEPVPASLRKKYFDVRSDEAGESIFIVRDPLRELLAFKRLNLNETPYPMRGPLDAIFVRNVMIYFDDPMRQKVIDQMERLLAPGGLLFIGHSETLTTIKTSLKTQQVSVYRKVT
jgi:chemotaxis protein methyltransferase CheR